MRYIQNLLNRHFDRDANVKPRVRGIYEDEADRTPHEKEENENRNETEDGRDERHRSRSTQQHAQTFWVSHEPSTGTLSESPKQAVPPHPISAERAVSRPHERDDERSGHAEKTASSQPHSSQEIPVANKTKSMQTDDSSGAGKITHSPTVRVAVPSNELSKVNRGPITKDSPYSGPESTRPLLDNGRAIEQNEKPVMQSVPPGNISPRQKEVLKTIERPLIQSTAKPTAQHVVNISIGRVEVRGSFSPVEAPPSAPPRKERTDRMTLDQYLNQQKSANR